MVDDHDQTGIHFTVCQFCIQKNSTPTHTHTRVHMLTRMHACTHVHTHTHAHTYTSRSPVPLTCMQSSIPPAPDRECKGIYPGKPARVPHVPYVYVPPMQLPEALTHQVAMVAGRAVTSTAETAVRPPTRLLRQSVHGLTRSHWARAGQEPLHSTVYRTCTGLEQAVDMIQARPLVLVRHAIPSITGCL